MLGYIRDMTHPPADPAAEGGVGRSAEWPTHPDIEPRESRNLLLLATHQIVLRVGWVFKTESVIMPAFLDQVASAAGLAAGAGWIRGCLPILNRLGQSVPPVFAANALKALPRKKHALAFFAVLMSLPFATMSLVWLASDDGPRPWMPWLFLGLYFVFFVFYGLYLLSFGTVQGKLIRPTRRGHLLLVTTFWGAIPAALVAVWLFPGWVESSPRWSCIFGFVAVCFALSGLIALTLFEPADEHAAAPARQAGSLADTVRTLRGDANLQRVVLTAVLFAGGLIVFPHYQALGRVRLGLTGVHWVVWVVTQNAAVAFFGLLVGPLADRRGYRLTLRLLIFGSAVAPAFAVSLSYLPRGLGDRLFWTVYVALGVTPLVLRTLLNYALEICKPEDHPRYLSIVSLGLAVPFLFSPLVGLLVDATGFEPVFLGTVCLIVASGLTTFWLDEPRERMGPGGEGGLALGPDD